MNIFYDEKTYHFCFYDSCLCYANYIPAGVDLTEATKSKDWLVFINKVIGTFYSVGTFEIVHVWRCNLLL